MKNTIKKGSKDALKTEETIDESVTTKLKETFYVHAKNLVKGKMVKVKARCNMLCLDDNELIEDKICEISEVEANRLMKDERKLIEMI